MVSPLALDLVVRQSLLEEMHSLLDKEETFRSQWARQVWLQEGDCNTRFLHQSATVRHQWNAITWIYAPGGQLLTNLRDVE